jgi:hypothetical protein
MLTLVIPKGRKRATGHMATGQFAEDLLWVEEEDLWECGDKHFVAAVLPARLG